MTGYFSYFPKINYTLENDNTNNQFVVNIFARSKFLREIADKSAAYYEYSIQDGETPEIIAEKLYGDPTRNWIVLLFNKIINPYYEFPMSNDTFEQFILSKYGQSIGESQNTIHHYELEVERSTYIKGFKTYTNTDKYTINEYTANYDSGKITERTLPAVNGSLEIDYVVVNMQEKTKVTLTGFITTYENNLTVSGSGTLFLSQVAVGDILFINGEQRYVTEVVSNTELKIRRQAGENISVTAQVMQRSNEIREEITRINAISNFTYEYDVNESRRKIQLLDRQYVVRVEDEFRKLMKL